MRFAGRLMNAGRLWIAEVPLLGLVQKSPTKKGACRMVAQAIESLVGREDFTVQVYPGRGNDFEIGSADIAALGAVLLRRQRLLSGLSLREAAARLGSASWNAYARYEQGASIPSLAKFFQLLDAVSPQQGFLLVKSGSG